MASEFKNLGERKLPRLEVIDSYTNDEICTAWATVRLESHLKGRPMSE